MKTYVCEYTERVFYSCTVEASSKKEAIAKVKELKFDDSYICCGSMPYNVRVLGEQLLDVFPEDENLESITFE